MSPRRIPYRFWLLAIFLVLFGVSMINPTDVSDMLLEHIPTAAVLAFLFWIDRRQPLSNLSYTFLFIFLSLHVLGAHYLYSNVPYDDWSRFLFGVSITEMFGFERNHYDRLVHFAFGLLLLPMFELVERFVPLRRALTLLVALAFMIALSTLYELGELFIALLMSPEAAENYNGQQGDIFDAQKDMAFALTGKLLVGAAILLRPAGGTD